MDDLEINQVAASREATMRRSFVRLGLGPLETEVMQILWTSDECSVRDVLRRMQRPTAYTTVMTTMVRLFAKGLLQRRRRDRKFLYSTRMTAEEWQRRTAADAAAQFFATPNVSRAMLATSLWEAISRQDPALLGELERQIQRKRREEAYLRLVRPEY